MCLVAPKSTRYVDIALFFSIQSRKITARTVKERARKVLEFTQKCAKGAPEVLDGDGLEYTRESKEDRALMRQVAGQTIVLLKNEGGLLPLRPKVRFHQHDAFDRCMKLSHTAGARPEEDRNRRWKRQSSGTEWRRFGKLEA